jgi:WD40 repeat protein
MSGYRSIHREKIGSFPIWQAVCSPVLTKNSASTTTTTSTRAASAEACWRVWLACGDGVVRGFLVIEKTLEQKDTLDAAACNFILTHTLLDAAGTGASSSAQREEEQTEEKEEAQQDEQNRLEEVSAIGCSQVQVARNYVGDDDSAGDLVVISSDLLGKIRIWLLSEEIDDELPEIGRISTSINADQEFIVENATGTCIKIMPPNVSGVGNILLAVPCLDGTIAIVATGLTTPKYPKDPTEAGTIVERWSKAATSIALSGNFHPKKKSFAVGRQDGLVDIFEKSGERCHRMMQHETPVRAVSYTPDGNLLFTSSDDGMVCMWDTSRHGAPVLVKHVVQAHTSWVLDLVSLSDSRRFVSCGMDQQLHVWSAGEMDNRALHSFTSDEAVWTIAAHTCTPTIGSASAQTATNFARRLISGSENGGLHIYTLES